MDAAPHKIGLTRLPVWAAAFVALVCVAIVALSGWTEWASREMELRNAEVELGNLARSLTQHAEDTVELADGILTGIVSRLETDGANPAQVAKLQTILNIRKSSLGRLRGLFVYDENGRWLATTETVNSAGLNNSDREYFRHHRESSDSGIFVGRPVHSRAGGQWVTTLSRRWSQRTAGLAGLRLPPSTPLTSRTSTVNSILASTAQSRCRAPMEQFWRATPTTVSKSDAMCRTGLFLGAFILPRRRGHVFFGRPGWKTTLGLLPAERPLSPRGAG
jgi:hypothetical protein